MDDQVKAPEGGQEPVAEVPLSQGQAAAIVGKHLLVVLEDVIRAHQLVIDDAAKSAVAKASAAQVIRAAKGFGVPLYRVVKAAGQSDIVRAPAALRIGR